MIFAIICAMKQEVIFTKQALSFLDTIPRSAQLRIRALFAALGDQGMLRAPMAEKVEGQKGLFEVRAKDASGQYRVFYVYADRLRIFALSGFVKKSAKTPRSEILKALAVRKELGL